MQRKETPLTSRNKTAFTSRKKKKKRDVKPEQMDHGSKEEHYFFERANIFYCRLVYVDAAVQLDLTASDIEVIASSSAFTDKSKKLVFATLICNTDC